MGKNRGINTIANIIDYLPYGFLKSHLMTEPKIRTPFDGCSAYAEKILLKNSLKSGEAKGIK